MTPADKPSYTDIHPCFFPISFKEKVRPEALARLERTATVLKGWTIVHPSIPPRPEVPKITAFGKVAASAGELAIIVEAFFWFVLTVREKGEVGIIVQRRFSWCWKGRGKVQWPMEDGRDVRCAMCDVRCAKVQSSKFKKREE
jgi:hypothetical protein